MSSVYWTRSRKEDDDDATEHRYDEWSSEGDVAADPLSQEHGVPRNRIRQNQLQSAALFLSADGIEHEKEDLQADDDVYDVAEVGRGEQPEERISVKVFIDALFFVPQGGVNLRRQPIDEAADEYAQRLGDQRPEDTLVIKDVIAEAPVEILVFRKCLESLPLSGLRRLHRFERPFHTDLPE